MRVAGGACEGDIDLSRAEKAQHLIAAAADDADVDIGIAAVKRVEIRQQELTRHGITRADDERAGLKRA